MGERTLSHIYSGTRLRPAPGNRREHTLVGSDRINRLVRAAQSAAVDLWRPFNCTLWAPGWGGCLHAKPRADRVALQVSKSCQHRADDDGVDPIHVQGADLCDERANVDA
jgi:hypothetical protein